MKMLLQNMNFTKLYYSKIGKEEFCDLNFLSKNTALSRRAFSNYAVISTPSFPLGIDIYKILAKIYYTSPGFEALIENHPPNSNH